MSAKGFVALAAALLFMVFAIPAAPAQSSQGMLDQLQLQIESLYARLAPSVVNITNEGVSYDQFQQPVPQQGTGSGFIYDRQGRIVTNYHVVENYKTLTVTLSSGKSYPATLVGKDPANDLAVIQIKAAALPDPIPVGAPAPLAVGQFVVAIGNPFGLDRTLTFGVISALGRMIQSPNGRFIGEAIQTDAAINPGNSGGPLLDMQGRVIGVNSQIISPSGTSAGVGFAVSSATVNRVVPQLIATGKYLHPWLGIAGIDLESGLADFLSQAGQKVSVTSGVYVAKVTSGSPAARSGIRGGGTLASLGNTQFPVGGDIITAVNTQKISSLAELTVYLDEKTKIGETVDVTVSRDGKSLSVKVKLATLPEEQ